MIPTAMGILELRLLRAFRLLFYPASAVNLCTRSNARNLIRMDIKISKEVGTILPRTVPQITRSDLQHLVNTF
jgi:hypothetical protein